MPADLGKGADASPTLVQSILRAPHLIFAAVAGLALLTGAVLIALLGDPRAGEPRVQMPILGKTAAPAPAGWISALAEATPGPLLTTEPLELFTEAPVVQRVTVGGKAMGEAAANGAAANPAGPNTGPLPPAPIAGLSTPSPDGPLPIVAPDGRTSAVAYARPFKADGRPRVALIVRGLGLNGLTTRQAIDTLPPEVTLSFVPYAEGLQGWINMARAKGHEVLLEVPMEPIGYPDNDPGPSALMADSPAPQTLKRLNWLLSRATGYFGVTNYLGSRFVGSDLGMGALLTGLHQRGLAFIDDGSAVKRRGDLPRASADRVLDDQLLSAEAIDKQLRGLETTAQQNGQALGLGFAYPVTLEQVALWSRDVPTRGFQLAPASAVMSRR